MYARTEKQRYYKNSRNHAKQQKFAAGKQIVQKKKKFRHASANERDDFFSAKIL